MEEVIEQAPRSERIEGKSLGLSYPAMEEALFDVPMYREFAQLPDDLVRQRAHTAPVGPASQQAAFGKA